MGHVGLNVLKGKCLKDLLNSHTHTHKYKRKAHAHTHDTLTLLEVLQRTKKTVCQNYSF